MPMHPRFIVAALALLCAAGPATTAADADAPAHPPMERWYVLLIGDERVGHAHFIQRANDEGHIVTENRSVMDIRRGPVEMRIEQASTFTETADGGPLRATARLLAGGSEQEQTLRFTDAGAELTHVQAGRTSTTAVDLDDDWLAPAAAQRQVIDAIDAGQDRITVRTLDLAAGPRPFVTTMTRVGPAEVELFGRVAPATAWDSTVSILPGITTRSYLDELGHALKTTIAFMPGMEITVLAADRDLALAEVDPPELLAALFIQLDEPLPNPRQLRQATFRLRFNTPPAEHGFALPSVGYQRVTAEPDDAETPDTFTIELDLDRPVTPAPDDRPTDADRAASPMIDHEDPKVRELLDQALGDDADTLSQAETAERLRRFVYDYITEKDLSVGLGSASETARTAQGDCTEHAVLLAALLRAADIPARTATGLLYVERFLGRDHAFGGHMWTQAWLDTDAGPAWLDLDPTFPPHRPYSATHITFATSPMAAGELTNDLVAIVPMLTGLQIELLEPAAAGEAPTR